MATATPAIVGASSIAPVDMAPTASVAVGRGGRSAQPRRQDVAEDATDFIGGDLAADDAGSRPPRPSQVVAVRGGSIMAENPAEQAARKRQLAAMLKDVDPPRVDFGITTGSTPTGTTP